MKKLVSSLALLSVLGAAAGVVYSSQKSDAQEMEGALAGPGAVAVAGAAPASSDAPHSLADLRLFNRVVLHLSTNYVEPAKFRPREMILSALDAVEKRVAEVLVDEREAMRTGDVVVTVGTQSKRFNISKVTSLWRVHYQLKEIFGFIQEHISAAEDTRQVEYAAINGMLATLDPHSNLLTPEQFTDMRMNTRGEFGGLGFVVSMRDGKLTIMKVLKDTPAHRGGIKPRDVITRIEDKSTVNMDLTEAVGHLRGKPKTAVTFFVDRPETKDQKPFSAKKFVLTRDIIQIESIDQVQLLAGGVGYVRITQFQGHTARDLHRALLSLDGQAEGGLKGLVLDLRNNPGGLLDQAIRVADFFVSEGTIVSTVGNSTQRKQSKRSKATGPNTLRDLPLAVLINNSSASASEIVAGAIKNLDRGVIIGETSYGKGSVQMLYDLYDNSALKLTVAQYLTPGDISIQEVGVSPDIELVPSLVSKQRVLAFAPRQSFREKDVEDHMASTLAVAAPGSQPYRPLSVKERDDQRPSASLTFLYEGVREGEEIDEFVEPDWKEDYQVRFAAQLIQSAGATTRPALLSGAAKTIAQEQDAQTAKVAEAITSLGVDWSPAADGASAPQLTASLKLKGKAQAGETVTVEVAVKNAGDAPAHRVRAWTESLSPRHVFYSKLFENLEFVFGKIGPGATQRWSAEVELPSDLPPRLEALKVHIDADGLQAPLSADASLTLKGLPRPKLGFSWWIDDTEEGNGDGRLSPGETVTLSVLGGNTGAGEATDVLATLKNLEDEQIYISQGRHVVGPLASGGEGLAQMRFSLREGFKGEAVQLRATLYDRGRGVYVSDDLTIPVAKSATSVQKKGGTARLKRAGGLKAWPSAAAPALAEGSAGARLPVTGATEGWLRVRWGDGRQAWIPAEAARLQKKKSAGPKGQLKPKFNHLAPTLTLGPGVPPLVTETESFSLSGQAQDPDTLRDLYIYRNNQKVFFKAFQAQGEGPARLDFTAEIPLETGANTIVIFARENDELMTRRTLTVFRGPETLASGAPAGAAKGR